MLLKVDDDGRGLPPPADAVPLAAPPAPVPPPSAPAQGDRLGMRIAQGLCRALRGELQLAGRPGGGTSAQVRFSPPAARAADLPAL